MSAGATGLPFEHPNETAAKMISTAVRVKKFRVDFIGILRERSNQDNPSQGNTQMVLCASSLYEEGVRRTPLQVLVA
jgi:hypothetical protein